MKNIYDDFSDEIVWCKKRILEDCKNLPESLIPLSQYYTSKRILVLPDKDRPVVMIDPELGRPIPYIVFWVTEALGLDRNIAKRLALGLLYATLAYVVLDDIVDEENDPTLLNVSLGNIYLHNYLASFDGLFDASSGFWHYLADSTKRFMKSLYDDYSFKHGKHDVSEFDPLSEQFLWRSCGSYSILVMTILVAAAYATNNVEKIPALDRFWYKYAMAHRLHDDLNDWMEDLVMEDYNYSPILIYALQHYEEKTRLSEEKVLSMFMSDEYVNRIYSVIFDLIRAASVEVSSLNEIYLSRYLDEQVIFHTRNRDGLLKTTSSFQRELTNILDRKEN
jgi:hypothetical protein